MPQILQPRTSDDRALAIRRKLKPRDALVRAAVAELCRQQVRDNTLESLPSAIARLYGGCVTTRDVTAAYIARAASTPAMTTVAGWAAELIQNSTVDFLGGATGRASALAQLIERGALLVPASGAIKIPARITTTLAGAWIGEGAAKPVYSGSLGSIPLPVFKVAVLSLFSEELLEHSTPSIELVVSTMLRKDLNGLVDQSLLDNVAASSVRPAGLLQGMTPIAPSASSPSSEAMAEDIAALSAAVSADPDATPVLVANVPRSARLAAAGYPTIVSGYVGNRVVAIDTSAIAVTMTPIAFAQSRNAAIHENTTALPLGTPPDVLAVPMRSLFQTDVIALRSVLRCGWVRLRANCTAVVESPSW